MTNKQYEHLGRAMMAAAELAKGVEALREMRNALECELSLLVGRDDAEKFAEKIMVECFPTYRLGDILTNIAKNVSEAKK